MNPFGAEGERLLELFYLCPTAILKIDMSGRILMMNAAGARILMPVAKIAVLENLYDLLEDAAPEIRRMAQDFPDRRGRICDEYRILALGGPPARSYIFSLTLQKIDDNMLVAALGDVTSTVMRDDVVRANEDRLHSAFDGAQENGIATFDLGGELTGWNRSAELMDGFLADEMLGRSVDSLLPADAGVGIGIRSALDRAWRDGSFVYENWRARKDGSRYWANSVISVIRGPDGDGFLGYSMTTRNVGDRKRSYDRLRVLAETDPLTGALNRRALFDAGIAMEKAYRDEGKSSAVLMLDIDHFKAINDRLGHDAGDAVLRSLVAVSCGEIRNIDSFARYGGEEFVVLLPFSNASDAAKVAERIRARVAAMRVAVAGTSVLITVSIGVATLDLANADIASTIRAADTAMYAAKSAGRNRVVMATNC